MSYKKVSEFESVDQLKNYFVDRKNNRDYRYKHCHDSYYLCWGITMIFLLITCAIISISISKDSCSQLDWFEERTNYTFHDCAQKQIDHDKTVKVWNIMFIPVFIFALCPIKICIGTLVCGILDCLDDRKLKKKLTPFNELEMQA